VDPVVITSVVRKVLNEEELKVDVVKMEIGVEVVKEDGMGGMGEDLLIGEVIAILGPTKDGPITFEIEVNVVKGLGVLTILVVSV